MVKKIDTAIVKLWGDIVGAVSWIDNRGNGVFEYDKDFLKKGFDIAPIEMSLNDAHKGDSKFSFSTLHILLYAKYLLENCYGHECDFVKSY